MGAGQQPTKQHFIFVFSALKQLEEAEFKLIIMKLYQEWRSGTGDGVSLTMLQLLVRADSEYKRLHQLGQWVTKNKASELMGLQAKLDLLQTQFVALMSDHNKLKQTSKPPPSNRPNGEPKPDENEERMVNGEKWYYCSKSFVARHWNKTHKTDEHKRGAGKNKINDTIKTDDMKDKHAHAASYDTGFGADADFLLG
jgi:hypothetical protein